MGSGGARNRSGPPRDPNSGRSDRLGVRFDALSADGYAGPTPVFPLPIRPIVVEYETGREVDRDATERIRDREIDLWAWAWSLPQAIAWSQPSEAWRLHTIAMWVRTFVVCESEGAKAADKSSLHRFADQIGLTPAGLRENGWVISREADSGVDLMEPPPVAASSRDRLKVMQGGREAS